MAEDLLFNHSLPTSLGNVNASSFALTEQTSPAEIMQTSIGQGTTLTTPLHMAMIVSAIANGGELMEPYIIDHSMNNQQQLVKQYDPQSYGNILSASEASALQELMRAVVTEGTGTSCSPTATRFTGKREPPSTHRTRITPIPGLWAMPQTPPGRRSRWLSSWKGPATEAATRCPWRRRCFDVYFQ